MYSFEFIDCRNSTAAAYHVRKGNNGGIRLPLHCETLQNLQRQKIFVHADGVVPGWWAMDNLKVRKVGAVIEKYKSQINDKYEFHLDFFLSGIEEILMMVQQDFILAV